MAEVKKSKQEKAYEYIKQAIIKNEFTSDSLLLEQDLCNRFGFSRTPVREALHRLSSEGFVETIKDKGTFVTSIGLEQLLQNYEIREALEGMAARLCATRANGGNLSILEKNLQDIEKCYKKQDYLAAMEHDMEFHRNVANATRNPHFSSTIQHTLDIISRVAFKEDDQTIIELSIEDHKQIFQALKEGDGEHAEAYMRLHIARSKKHHFEKYYFAY